MSNSSMFLTTILGLGLFYSFFRLFTGKGGSGLGDFIDVLGFTSLIMFTASLLVLIFNFWHVKRHTDVFIFLLLGLPMTLMAICSTIQNLKSSRTPDLSAKYLRPVSDEQFKNDSIHIQEAIDSLMAIRNRNTGGIKVKSAFIDTIIYSQKGDQVFVSYIKQFEPNNLGNDLDPDFLYGNPRNPEYWNLEEGTPNAYRMSGSFHEVESLKAAVRRFYFNSYSFHQKDSLKENYFWK